MTTKRRTEFKCLSFLFMLTVTIMQISVVVPYKSVLLGGLLLPGGVIGFPLVFTLSDIVAEVYGYKHARKMIWQAILCCAIFVLIIIGILHLPSPPHWAPAPAYKLVFAHILRVFFAILFGVSLSSFVNIYLFVKWKIWLKGKHFWLRCFLASAIGETVVTFIADITGFLGAMPFSQFIHMVLSVYLFKIIYSLAAAFPATLVVIFLKRYEGIDVYDYTTNFNPFSLDVE